MVEGISAICASGWRRILCIYGVFSDRFFGNICGVISVIHFLVFAFKIPSQHLVIYIGGHPVSTLFHLQFDRTSGQLEERNVILLAQVVKPLGKWVFSTISQRSYGPIQINYFIAFIPQQIFSLSPSVHHNPGHLSLHMWAAKSFKNPAMFNEDKPFGNATLVLLCGLCSVHPVWLRGRSASHPGYFNRCHVAGDDDFDQYHNDQHD